MMRLPFLHILHGVSAPPETPNKALERNRHSGVVSVFFHSGEIVGFGEVALSWRSLSSAFIKLFTPQPIIENASAYNNYFQLFSKSLILQGIFGVKSIY
jgi:hypothetical protein